MQIEVQIRQPRADCPIYTWDRERGCLRLTGISHATPGLPADLATLHLEGRLDVPILLLTRYSSPPGTLESARLLGALGYTSSAGEQERSLPVDDWIFVAVAEADASPYHSLEMLPAAQLAMLQAYVQAQAQEELQLGTGEIQSCASDTAARLIRETRLVLKREQRMQPRGKGWLKRNDEEERPVAWRAIEGLAEALRLQVQQEALLQDGVPVPHAQAEQLIRFVPQRFQHALTDLLLDDERLLAFVERPLLRHRTGWLGVQTWRSNEGLFLVTDRQVIWLRDFLTPGSSFLSGGYIAHMAPLERLQDIALLPPGTAPPEFADRLEAEDSPYPRLVMEVTSCTGGELFVVEFPHKPEMEKALARITSILRAFLSYPQGTDDRRLRRLPVVEAWLPRGAEAEQLAILGGMVPAVISQRLEQRFTDLLDGGGEEVLASALVPALEDYKSPARLVALTRRTLFVLEDAVSKSPHAKGAQVHVHRYDLAAISSAQLRYSLLGSSLSIFVPQPTGRTRQHIIPFHSPAIARFLPLFTRLRTALGGPYRTS